MVQEFYLLRCFSCQTFQVQQVKKSKKWTCKVCGEKQSLIKEFGRGAAADCRRHVQKLNALRGQMLEVNREQLLTPRSGFGKELETSCRDPFHGVIQIHTFQTFSQRFIDSQSGWLGGEPTVFVTLTLDELPGSSSSSSLWEPDENYENEDVHESLDEIPKSEQDVAHVSRWSKYTDQTAEGPNGHEDEEEDEHVYTETHRFRSQGNRKRKKVSSSASSGGSDGNCEDEESWTGSGFKRRLYLHDRRFSSSWSKGSASRYSSCGGSGDVEPCASTNLPSSRQAVCYPAACSSSTNSAEDSGENRQQCNSSHEPPAAEVTKGRLQHSHSLSVSSRQKFGELKDSKWDKFLTVVPDHQDEEEDDCEAHDSSSYSDNTAVACFTEALTDMRVDSGECRYTPDGKMDSGVVERQKSVGDICVEGNISSSNNSHSSKSAGFENAVCKQPSLNKMPSSLFINSLFFTDEDFDDTF